MYKFKISHKITLLASLAVWVFWIVFAIIYRQSIIDGGDTKTQFFMLLIWSFIIYLAMLYPVFSPDMNLVPKKHMSEKAIEKLIDIRRMCFVGIQFLFVFLACGTSVSLFFTTWRIGVGITVLIYALCMFAVLLATYLRTKHVTKNHEYIPRKDEIK